MKAVKAARENKSSYEAVGAGDNMNPIKFTLDREHKQRTKNQMLRKKTKLMIRKRTRLMMKKQKLTKKNRMIRKMRSPLKKRQKQKRKSR